MSQRIAVALIHGTGQKEPDFADDIIEKLNASFQKHLPGVSDAELVIEPVYWAAIPRKREEEIWERVKAAGPMDHMQTRRFLFNVAGDTLAYQPNEGRKDLYLEVHRCIAETFQKLAERAGEDAPLCVVTHSMGSIVAHNYLYDMQHKAEDEYELERPETPLERCATLALFVTFGSPLAIWRLRFGDEYKAIEFPGEEVEERYPHLRPKWLNIYDADDVLGYPIGKLTERYEELVADGYLEDRQKNVGAFYKSWNPLAHKGYLRDDTSLEELAQFIAAVWQGAYAPDAAPDEFPERDNSLAQSVKERLPKNLLP